MRKLGFTLAEVLITLVIIGVIAAMTVPTLMQNTNAQENRSALKKSISALNQALQLEYALEGLIPGDANVNSAADVVANIFKKRMAVMETTESGQWKTSVTPNRAPACEDAGTFTTTDGIKYCLTNFNADTTSDDGNCNMYNTKPCAQDAAKPNFWIDVNGDKKPNLETTTSKRPRDIYQATLFAQKVVPFGEPTQGVMYDRQTADQMSN